MTAAAIIAHIRRLMGEVLVNVGEDLTPEYSDVALLDEVTGAALELSAIKVVDEDYVIASDPDLSITPEPTTIDGLLLATLATANLIAGDLARKVRNGELGLRFVTGLNEISTVEAGRRITEQAKELRNRFERLKTFKISGGTDWAAKV